MQHSLLFYAAVAFFLLCSIPAQTSSIVPTYKVWSNDDIAGKVVIGEYTVLNYGRVVLRTGGGGPIYYTLDGSEPTMESTRYVSILTIPETTTIRAIAYSADFSQSASSQLILKVVPGYNLGVGLWPGGAATFTVTPGAGLYASNTFVRARATSASGWTFQQWKETGGTNPVWEFNLRSNTVVTPIFLTFPSYVVTGQGTIEGSKSPAAWNEHITVTAIPAEDWYFSEWFGAFTGTRNPVTFAVNKPNQIISAVFEQLAPGQATITAHGLFPNSIQIVPLKNVYTNGEIVTIKLRNGLYDGYAFTGWSGDASGAQDPLIITADGSKNFTANFQKLETWKSRGLDAPGRGAAIGNDNSVLTADSTRVYSFTPGGALKWTYQAPVPELSTPSVGPSGNIYVGSANGTILALSSHGQLLWTNRAGTSHAALAIGADETVYAASGNDLYAIRDGITQWQRPGMGAPVISGDGIIHLLSNSYDPSGNSIAFTGNAPAFYALNAADLDGTVFGTFRADNKAWFGARHANGSMVWSNQIGNLNGAAALGEGGYSYYGTGNLTGSNFHAFSHSGELQWRNLGAAAIATSGMEVLAWFSSGFTNLGTLNEHAALKSLTSAGETECISFFGSNFGYGYFSQPIMAADGTVYYTIGDINDPPDPFASLYAVKSLSSPAKTPWAMHRADAQNTGRAEPPIRKLRLATSGSGAILNTTALSDHELYSIVTLQAQPQPGSRFVRWEGDVNSSSNPVSFNISSHKSITAVFGSAPPTLNAEKSGNNLLFTAAGQPGTQYQLQRSSDLGTWEVVETFTQNLSNTLPITTTNEFFRIRTLAN